MSNNFIPTIERAIAKLRQLVKLEVQRNWRDVPAREIKDLNLVNLEKYQLLEANEKGYLVFPQGKQVKWLVQKIIIPPSLSGYPLAGLSLRLVLTWWAADAKIFLNGELVQAGDLFDSSARILITDCAQSGQEYLVAIRLVSPGHDLGALMRSHVIYERVNQIDPGLVADELTVLSKYLVQFEPDKLNQVATELERFNWDNLQDADKFDSHLADLRTRLLPLAQNIQQRCFNLLGHAHLDMAWLWTTDETYEVGERTFRSVLNLQQNFPYLTFAHTTPALYEWIEKHRPNLFAAIQKAVSQGKWEIIGGMWVEPEVNLVNGESLIRQLLYGQRYIKDKFGYITKVAWLPDSFGFTWQLPQIFEQSGIEYFVTGKLHWNDTNRFPLGCFWWESPDGTQLLTVMSPPNVTGVMDTNPLTMAEYGIDWETNTGLQEIFWLPGVGDHGGGPTKDMLEVAAKWQNSPFFPEIKFTTATEYLSKIAPHSQLAKFPVWKDELYLELHRGCYTVHAEQKKFNRYCEGLLYQAELWSTIASLLDRDWFAGQPVLPIVYNTMNDTLHDWQDYLEQAWKKVLFNQFHDILPGTSIREVFESANQDWQTAIAIGENILQTALAAIAHWINLPSPPNPQAKPIVVFNSLNWKRTQIVKLPFSAECRVFDEQGTELPTQLTADKQLIFLARDIPSVGYRLFWLDTQSKVTDTELEISVIKETEYRLENQYLKVMVNSHTGDLDSIYDKIDRREILNGAGNQLQAFVDQGQYWDAWNIAPEYEQHPLPPTQLKSIQWLERGELQQCLRVVRTLGKSTFTQDYILELHSPSLKIANTVDWQETHVLVKAAFPFNLTSDFTTCEIPYGAIAHPTQPQTELERAKWEVSLLKWVDISDRSGEYGVSLLNDSKYGCDYSCHQLRLTLLRSPVWPDPQADRGIHKFTYAIYPHQHNWQTARTVHQSYELNIPLSVVTLDDAQPDNYEPPKLASTTEFLNLTADNLILSALKPAQDNDVILRCYECHGTEANLSAQGFLNWKLTAITNCLETETSSLIESQTEIHRGIKPWKIATFKLQPQIKYSHVC